MAPSPESSTSISPAPVSPGPAVYKRPLYARCHEGERRRRRAWLSLLALMCLMLSCRPADGPTTQPDPSAAAPTVETPRPADPDPVPAEPEPNPVAVEPRELLPAPPPRSKPADDRPPGPLILRVGLATDLDYVDLPCCNGQIQATWGNEQGVLLLDRATRVTPETGIGRKAYYRLQVAALKDEVQARGIADYLRRETQLPADSIFDADTDLYRVRVGRFNRRAEAEETRGRLARLGVNQGWVVSEGGALENAALRVTQGGSTHRVDHRWLELRAPDSMGIPFANGRYRGKLLVFLNERGRLNVINEIPLETYLRGVVPKEMGPELYNELEALKAQTVAARTYTLRNLGEFAQEGYDICSTPRCQVYGGMAVEHPVSDRAIRDTAGQVLLFDDRPIEAFYSATSGGHTENVEVIFPLKQGDYLRGVPCLEAGPTHVQGSLDAGTTFPSGLMSRLLPKSGGKPSQELSARLEHLALLANLSIPRDRLSSLQRQEVLRFVMSIYDMAVDRRMASRAQVEEILGPGSDWSPADRRLAMFLRLSGYLDSESNPTLGQRQISHLLYELAVYFGVLREEKTHFLKLEGGNLRVRRGGEHLSYSLPGRFATYRRRGSELPAGALDLVPGDRVSLFWLNNELTALVQPVDAPPVELKKHAPKHKWQVFKTDRQLRTAVQKRYPGFPFLDFEVLSRGVSGRVGRIALIGEGGERLEVEGLAVRWTLDVWDTLFQVQRTKNSKGQSGYLFRGGGWGHGVGMSQAGAFGMARRGVTYREILKHYYTGVQLGRLKPAPARPRLPAD